MDVPETAPADLQVRFEHERHLVVATVAGDDRLGEGRQPQIGASPPLAGGVHDELLGQVAVAGQVAGTQQGCGRVEVAAGEIESFGRGSDRVPELRPFVPDRVPEVLGDGGDVARAVMD